MNSHRIALTGLLLAIGLLTSSCSKQEPTAPEPLIRPVRYERVSSTGGTRDRTFSGATKAGTELQISFKVPGTLYSLAVEVGDSVEADDLIAELDPRDYELQVEEIRALIAQGRARARNASTDYERVRGLYENSNASEADLDAARAAAESADATVRSLEKKLELAQLQVSYMGSFEPFCDLAADLESLLKGQRSLVQPLSQRLALNQLKYNKAL